MNALTLAEIDGLTGGKLGVFDLPCPECGSGWKTESGRKKKVMRIWRTEADFARYNCARCGLKGYAHDGSGASATDRARWAKARTEADRRDSEAAAQRIARALAIWDAAGPELGGTPADTYLAGRGLAYQGEALRWHPSCPFGRGERHGCMLGLVRNIVTNKPQAVHRTAIDANGRKIGRKAYGPIAGGAIKLTDDADVTIVIAIGEGVESTLSIRALPDLEAMPVCAVMSAAGIAAFPALRGIETVWIATDNDLSGAGQNAARTAVERLQAAGIESFIVKPIAVGADLNDRVTRHG